MRLKYRVGVNTNMSGSLVEDVIEIDDPELDDLSEEELEDCLWDNYGKQWLWDHIEFYGKATQTPEK